MATDEKEKKEGLMSRSSDSEAMLPYWDKVDAIVAGADAMKLAGTLYLPKFANETEDDYKSRLNLSKFTNIFRDICEGLASKPFEEEVKLQDVDKAPQEIISFIENVDGSGNNLTTFAALTFFNGIVSAIDWIFVDYPTIDTKVIKTKADMKEKGVQPFWSHVLGRNILEARTDMVNGKETLSYVKIFEPATSGPNHIRLFERTETGWIIWQLWAQKEGATDEWLLENEGVLSIKVIPLVPFITGRRDGKTFKIAPAMQDAADLQISLYQDESALQFIKTMAGYPMLAANGMKPQYGPDNKTPLPVAIGPGKVLYGTPDANGNHGSWTYVEPSAQSMEFLLKSIDATKNDLRELGRQPLTAQSGNLTVITTAVAAAKGKSAVVAWALALKDMLENAMLITDMWLNTKYEPEIEVFTEFDSFAEGDSGMSSLDAARNRGDISQETYWAEMQRRGILSPEFDPEEERERILADIPSNEDEEDGVIKK